MTKEDRAMAQGKHDSGTKQLQQIQENVKPNTPRPAAVKNRDVLKEYFMTEWEVPWQWTMITYNNVVKFYFNKF